MPQRRSRFGFTALSNGFAAWDDPDGLQAICAWPQPGTIEAALGSRYVFAGPFDEFAATKRRPGADEGDKVAR